MARIACSDHGGQSDYRVTAPPHRILPWRRRTDRTLFDLTRRVESLERAACPTCKQVRELWASERAKWEADMAARIDAAKARAKEGDG